MPEIPAFIADVLEPRFTRRAEVSEVEPIGAHLRRVRFIGDALRGALHLFDHGEGPGATWLRGLHPGQVVRVLGPGGSFALRTGYDTHVLAYWADGKRGL